MCCRTSRFIDLLPDVQDLQPTPPSTPHENMPFSALLSMINSAETLDIPSPFYEPFYEDHMPCVQDLEPALQTQSGNNTSEIDGTEKDPLPVPQTQNRASICPVPGCGKSVIRLWNHIFQFHKKEGSYTGNQLHKHNMKTLNSKQNTYYKKEKDSLKGLPLNTRIYIHL